MTLKVTGDGTSRYEAKQHSQFLGASVVQAMEPKFPLRLDKNVNKGFSPEMGSLMVHYTPKNSPPESTHGKTSFSAQIQDGRHYTWYNIEMDITLDLSNI